MPISTGSNKEKEILFSDPPRFERSIRKERLATSIDINSTSSTDTCERAPIDTSHSDSIDTNPRADMVVNLVLIHDEIGDLHDHEGYPRNAAGQRIDDQGTVIPNLEGVVQ